MATKLLKQRFSTSTQGLSESLLAKRDAMAELTGELGQMLAVFDQWEGKTEGLHGAGVNDGDVAEQLRLASASIKHKMAIMSTIDKYLAELQTLFASKQRAEKKYQEAVKKDSYADKQRKLKDQYEEAEWRYLEALAETEGFLEFIIEQTQGGGAIGLARAELSTLKLAQIQLFGNCLNYCQKTFEAQPEAWKVGMRDQEWQLWKQERDISIAAFKSEFLDRALNDASMGSMSSMVARFGNRPRKSSDFSISMPSLPASLSRHSSISSQPGYDEASPPRTLQKFPSSPLSSPGSSLP
eukprot:CAMPEP_0171562506 /NCGR_PEP_ID=MMETSP0960-20121227/15033_1 /TAXON_ID=87120 /ORGANISM="Aurantiochytrium limacinum, Strain ATCCMYA-1381" /LENGTH=296 /DNA_ID=CAMNT_0012115311 /DNA_START=18 /DNA_END=905 /DNA_ORIENTATION=+